MGTPSFPSRRNFLQRSLTGAVACGSSAGLGLKLPAVTGQEASQSRTASGKHARDTDIEPLVQLLEKTPREDLMERVAGSIHSGTSYQDVLAALQLAGVRNVSPRPSVGFKFHSVLVVNSAHLASMAAPDEDRWLPILWAIDYFKETQIAEQRSTGWKMEAVDETRLPSASRAHEVFCAAMEAWDPEAADSAIAQLARSGSAGALFDTLCRYGARDYRSIGHKAIFTANSFRTLAAIGWRHAEPILRSLAFALQNHVGDPNPAASDLEADRPWRRNLELQAQFRDDWLEGTRSTTAAQDLVVSFRTSGPEDSSRAVLEAINAGISPAAAWDAIFLASGELLMQQPGIVGLHSLTTANALRYAYQQCSSEETRRMMLLQAAAFVPMFRRSAAGRGKLSSETISTTLTAASREGKSVDVAEIFALVSEDRRVACEELYRYLCGGGDPYAVVDEARRLVFRKGRDAHDYKYSSAVLEDYAEVSPALRNQFLALSIFNLPGSGGPDNGLVDRIRSALA
jgi:hypothetical protein